MTMKGAFVQYRLLLCSYMNYYIDIENILFWILAYGPLK